MSSEWKTISLVNLTVRIPGMEKTDKVMTRKSAEDFRVRGDVVKTVRKILKEALSPLTAVRSSARTQHLEMTWHYTGSLRYVFNKELNKYDSAMVELKNQFDEHLQYLVENWEGILEVEKEIQGDRFTPEDYPSAEELRDSCSFEHAIIAMGDPSDINDGTVLGKLRQKEAETRVSRAIAEAANTTWVSVTEQIEAVAERLSSGTSPFKLVKNWEKILTHIHRGADIGLGDYYKSDAKTILAQIAEYPLDAKVKDGDFPSFVSQIQKKIEDLA